MEYPGTDIPPGLLANYRVAVSKFTSVFNAIPKIWVSVDVKAITTGKTLYLHVHASLKNSRQWNGVRYI